MFAVSNMNDNTNGKLTENGAGLPSVIEVITQSGVQIFITPLSLFTIQALINKSETEFPYPDDKPYREASDLIASGFIPASENPEYQALCKAVDGQRAQWQHDAIIELACKYPQWQSRTEMMAHFRPRLEELRPYIEMHDAEWQNVLEHCVFTGTLDMRGDDGVVRTTERHRVIQLARQNASIALTMPEVIGALRVFRVQISGTPTRGLAGASRGAKERD